MKPEEIHLIDPYDVKRNIKRIRKNSGLTQRQFQELYNRFEPKRIRISTPSTISLYEAGSQIPFADQYLKILKLEDFTPEALQQMAAQGKTNG